MILLERLSSYATKVGLALKEQGIQGLLAKIAGKIATLFLEAANLFGDYAARHWRFHDNQLEVMDMTGISNGKGLPADPVEIWVDVGAHMGELTFAWARDNPDCVVYAFEPNIKAASKVIGKLPNFVVIPLAVATKNGFEIFHENAYEASSSLLPIDEEVRKVWVGGKELEVVNEYLVPTVRLDTFMDIMHIPRVDFLKIDTQGFDYEVVISCGERLQDISRIQLEVTVTSRQFYRGAKGKQEITEFLISRGFSLVEVEKQTYGAEENLLFVQVGK